ncbi:hypothetical protein B0H21DRAFT_289177 [Amylocystis lapponica]|nr:hypothetical protein B0H21DRAFT_289177 [Amylocystis lapponica]
MSARANARVRVVHGARRVQLWLGMDKVVWPRETRAGAAWSRERRLRVALLTFGTANIVQVVARQALCYASRPRPQRSSASGPSHALDSRQVALGCSLETDWTLYRHPVRGWSSPCDDPERDPLGHHRARIVQGRTERDVTLRSALPAVQSLCHT